MFGFGKKKEHSEEAAQSQNIQGSVSGQIGQAKGNLKQVQQAAQSQSSQKGSEVDVVKLLETMVQLVKDSQLPNVDKEKAINRINAVKAEATEDRPDAATIFKTLHRVMESVRSTHTLYRVMKPYFDQLKSWLDSNGNELF
ncbi:MAG: hypothetical protein SAJ12_17375 [Jaaginema sp. PMC 1079.18]|nr:hypothetical protein [Jaaginema sp. PMC 1080.18]MEC4852755.1 hypothetical protein [Jaaginema sp. PMC 1079.18]MEC4868324.1 hypothetical protein [Jaaginema sp. PMC 1078.18]